MNNNQEQQNQEVAVAAPKQLGRPVNASSARQQRINEIQARKESGNFKLGRPVVEGSKRQIREAELAEKRVSGELKKGRPINPNSKKQIAAAEKAWKLENGIAIKKGRPVVEKVAPEEVVTVTASEIEEG